jgi:hypothetical protein
MKPWIDEMAEYVKPDYLLTSIVAGKLTEADLQEVVGSAVAGVYPLTTAQSLHKKQYKLEEYIDRCNVVEFKNEIVLKLLQGRKRDPLSENQLEEIFKLASVEVRHESSYPLGEVVKLLKAQEHPKAEDYVWLKKRADSLGYSTERMLEILKERATYLMERGSTLNNPHISGSYFHGWPRIENNYADELRKKVRKYLESVSS